MNDTSVVLVGANGFWSRRECLQQKQLPLELVFEPSLMAPPETRSRVWGIVAADQKISDELMASYPNLRTIARTGTGYDGIDLVAAQKRGITVTRVAKLNAEAVSEFALAYIFELCKDLTCLREGMHRGHWKHDHESRRIGALTVGIVGLGMIGQSLAHKLYHLGVHRLLGWNRTLRPEVELLTETNGLLRVTLPELLKESDVVVLALALTKDTRRLIDRKALARMKQDAFLINICRGAVVDEEALADAVAQGNLGGVALDVYSDEPPNGKPFETPYLQSLLRSAELGRRVILTPHCAGKTERAVDRVSEQVAHNLAAVWKNNLAGVEVVV